MKTRLAASTVVALALLFPLRRARALETAFGGTDFKVRWDNTLRSTLGIRTTSPDPILGANPAFSASEYSFAKGDLNAARLDLLSELDASYKEIVGARASFVGWYDLAYREHAVTMSPALASQNVPSGYVGDELSKYVLDRYRGPGGEFLDAYGWARLRAGPIPLQIKAGRFLNYWSESISLAGSMHGAAYSQTPLDLAKAFANPGSDRKELLRPLGRIAADAKLLPSLTLSGEYLLEWQSYIYPEGATFAGPADFAFNGPDGQFARLAGRPIYIMNGGVDEPGKMHDWGVAMRYNPDFLKGTVGLTYRRYSDKLASVLVVPNPGGQGPMSPALSSPVQYKQYYAEGIDMFGLSYSRKIFPGATGALETTYRHDTPLTAQALGFATAPAAALSPLLFPHGAPELIGNSYQARGDTFHVVANMRGLLPEMRLFSGATWSVEGYYDRLITIRENEDMFYGVGHGVCSGSPALAAAGLAKTTNDGCATENAAGVSATFSPVWRQVFTGVDLYLPLQGSAFVWGNSPMQLGGNAGSGTYAAGVGAEVRKKLRLDLKYTGFFGDTIDNGKVVTSNNGLLSLLKNRESIVFLAKTTF